MNEKEVGELRRRFKADKSAITHVRGCYVNEKKEIVSQFDQSLALMSEEESEKLLAILRRTLSGGIDRNLVDISFATKQVAEGEEHKLLMALRDSGLGDEEAVQAFFQKAIDSLALEGSYLILLAHDRYDVPYRAKDGETQKDASEEVYSYILCSICPVKDGTPELGYFHGENEFHISMEKQIVGQPELGFLFPAFDDRTANLYNALFYSRKPDAIHQEFIDAVFCTEPPMSAAEQRETFQSALCDALEESCSMEVVQSVHDYLRQRIQEHKDSRDPEPLAVTAGEVSGVLRNCGVPEARVEAFQSACGKSFGEGALAPANLIDAKHFAVKTADATIQVDPERSYLVEARIIDGRRYLLVPADESVEVNGLGVRIAARDSGETN